MKIKRIKSKNGFEISEKRFYVPFIASEDCPECGRNVQVDFSNYHYFSYPKLGVPIFLSFYCNGCNKNWTKQVKLEISLKEVKDTPEESV